MTTKNSNRKALNRMFWIGMIPILIVLLISLLGIGAYISTHGTSQPVEDKPVRDTVVVEKEVIRYRDTFIPPAPRKERKPEIVVPPPTKVLDANTPDTTK